MEIWRTSIKYCDQTKHGFPGSLQGEKYKVPTAMLIVVPRTNINAGVKPNAIAKPSQSDVFKIDFGKTSIQVLREEQ